jgi:hypothetical protein
MADWATSSRSRWWLLPLNLFLCGPLLSGGLLLHLHLPFLLLPCLLSKELVPELHGPPLLLVSVEGLFLSL